MCLLFKTSWFHINEWNVDLLYLSSAFILSCGGLGAGRCADVFLCGFGESSDVMTFCLTSLQTETSWTFALGNRWPSVATALQWHDDRTSDCCCHRRREHESGKGNLSTDVWLYKSYRGVKILKNNLYIFNIYSILFQTPAVSSKFWVYTKKKYIIILT